MDIALFLVLAWSLFTQVCPVSLDDAQTALTQNVQIIAQKGYAGIEAPYGYGVTTGGQGGKVYTVATDGDLHKALNDKVDKRVILISGTIPVSNRMKVPSKTSIIGQGNGAILTNNGMDIKNVNDVIIQNLKISKILKNDGLTLQNATRVWIDHNEFESDCCAGGPDKYDGQVDIVRATDFVTVSWNYFHDHWKSSLVGNMDSLRSVDTGHLRVTYHHNFWKHEATRGPAGRFGHQHIFNNLYQDFLYQAIHSRSDNQVLVEANVFRGNCSEALSTYGLVIPMDSPNTSPQGDKEKDGFANLGSPNDWGKCKINITRTGTFTSVPYKYNLTPLGAVEKVVREGAGVGRLAVQ